MTSFFSQEKLMVQLIEMLWGEIYTQYSEELMI